MKHLYIVTLLFVTFSYFGCTSSDTITPVLNAGQLDELDKGIEQITRDFDLMGLAVVYIQDFQIAYEGYSGYAVYENQTPLSRNSVVRIASPSKTLTAIALMQLHEQGLVDIDDDVSTYLGWELRNPNWPESPITLRMLLGHTASIADGAVYSAFSRTMISEQLPIRMLFTGTDSDNTWSEYNHSIFSEHEPGSYFSYSNAAWGLIANVIEIVSGDRFDVYTRENIFEPLGIEASFNITDVHPDRVAALYRHQNDTWAPQVDYFLENGPQERAYEGYEPGKNGLIYGPQGSLRISTRGLMSLADVLLNSGTTQGLKIGSVTGTTDPFSQERTSVQLLREETFAEMSKENWSYDGGNGDTWDDFWLSFGLGLHRLTGEPGRDVIFSGKQMIGHPGIAYGLLSDIYVDPATGSGVIYISTGSKTDFEYGDISSFYEVEEAVFKLIESIRE
ncbi:MAG: beta-lactamase family protein [Balneolales bacterium]|nr:beta-lactamase family protein [Balneolales bacterium]